MNKKNNEKRASASVNLLAHRRLKQLAKGSGYKLNHLIDIAVFQLLKRHDEFKTEITKLQH